MISAPENSEFSAEELAQLQQFSLVKIIELYKHMYENEQNGIYVWCAIAYSFQANITMPDWCSEYLSSAATSIFWTAVHAGVGRPINDVEPERQNLTAAAAVRDSLRHLGLQRVGWNGFNRGKENAALMADALLDIVRAKLVRPGKKDGPISTETVMSIIKTRRKMTKAPYDDRQPQRRIREGTKLLPDNLKPEPKPKPILKKT